MKSTPPSDRIRPRPGLLDLLDLVKPRRPRIGAWNLQPEGLACFNRSLHQLSPESPAMTMDQIATAARRALARHRDGGTPPFVQSRMEALERLELLAADLAWRTEPLVQRQVAILRRYRQETCDLIPDQQPVIGLLDDAVLVDVALQVLHAELALYEDFCRFRHVAADFAGLGESATGLTRDHWLAAMLESPTYFRTASNLPATNHVPDPRAILFHVT